MVVAPSDSTLFSAVVGAMVGAGDWRWLALVVGACSFARESGLRWSTSVGCPQEVVLFLLRSRFVLVTGVLQ